MRRLPIFFLIDVSESMVGEQILQVEEGVARIIKEIKSDPHSIETVWISIIVFAGRAKTLVPLQEIVSFYPPKFPIGGGTSLGRALKHLMNELKHNVRKSTLEQKGDWKPIVFLLTDGAPTDEVESTIDEWKASWGSKANLVAICFGEDADQNVLRKLTDQVIFFNNASSDDYRKFFKWITDSIKTNSVRVENNNSGFQLPELDGRLLRKIDVTKSTETSLGLDPNFVVLTAKCQNTLRPYLIKYKRKVAPAKISGITFETRSYKLIGGFQADHTYFELSDDSKLNSSVSTGELHGAPSCPCCGNQFSIAVCRCAGIHCIGDERVNKCPWCGQEAVYSLVEGDFHINRSQG